MSQSIEIYWPDFNQTIKAGLLSELNAELCTQFLKTLPFKSIQSHAVVAGKQMYFPYRLNGSSKHYSEAMDKQPIGRINIELDFQYLSINYGPMTEPVPAVPVAQVDDGDIELLQQIGEKVWHNLLFEDRYLQVHVRWAGDDVYE
ncbi:hypothetical protein ACFSCZ_19310 [Siminovitchia sediminis]|uniref:Uncharacterized protein n=1 Tax=Siminovitchia sediminis TaxID=1274353 RepID=A0ABW4KKZ0_9BACI